jgi:FkbM family methyltransferase
VFFFGAHEREQMIFSRRYINNGVVVDCGANSGNHSLFYSAFSKKVLSIEANPILALEIKNRISMNSITNITLCNIGVGSRDETQRLFYQAAGDNKGVSSFVKNFHEENRNVVNIRIQTLDSILSELGVSNVDFIKIDVEGFDYETLKGAHKTILRCSPVIQIEYAPRDKSKMTTFLRENPRYLARSLIVNRPFFVFNRPRGILVEWDPDFRSEVFLTPK